MELTTDQQRFVESTPSAAMMTIGADGIPKVARCGVAVVDGRLWSSGTQARVRTRRLRTDPRCTLYVHEAGPRWLAMETTVKILEGADAPEEGLRLFRVMQHRPSGPLAWFGTELDDDAFRAAMVDGGRLVYEFELQRVYGQV